MTEVLFYMLSQETEAEKRNLFACRLAQKAFKEGCRVYLHTPDQASAEVMDRLLWQYPPSGFIPHGLLGQDGSERVALGWEDNPGDHNDVLINLATTVPGFVGRFRRASEVVVFTPSIQEPLRKSWAYYRDRGYPIESHEYKKQV